MSASGCMLWLTLIFALVFSTDRAVAQVGIDQSIGAVRGWEIGLSDTTGGCLATTSFTDGTNLFVGFSGDGTAYLAFTNRQWSNIKPDRRYNVALVMLSYGTWRGEFLGFEQMDGKGLLGVGIKTEFVAALMGARGVTVYLGQRRIVALSLRGSSAAMQKVIECQSAGRASPRGRSTSPQASREQPQDSSGTGFFVTDRGHVLTNHHVAGKCDRITVRSDGGVELNANLVASDATNDLALLATAHEKSVPAAFSRNVRLGSSIYVFGYPLSGLLASSGNFTMGNVTALAGINDNSTMLQISAPVQPGNSGGALLNEQGAVVGVIRAKLDALGLAGATSDIAQNVNFAIKSSIALNFLETANIQPNYLESGSSLAPADIADHAKKFSAQVFCRVGPADARSSVRRPTVTSAAPGSDMRIEKGKSFMSAGYRPAGARTVETCAETCSREARCVAFQFSHNPVQDERVHRALQCRLYDDERNLETVSSDGNTIGIRSRYSTGDKSEVALEAGASKFTEHRSRAMEGGDLQMLRGETLSGCSSACANESRCMGYSFDFWNKYCFLKAELGSLRRDPRYLTAVRGTSDKVPSAVASHSIQKRSNKYFPSGAYQTRMAQSFEECSQFCLGDERCDAISYQRQSRVCSILSEPSEYFQKPGSDVGLRVQEP